MDAQFAASLAGAARPRRRVSRDRSPTGRYLVRAAWAEARILARRRSIVDIVADPATTPPIASKLRLVLAARSFAAESIGLRAKESFTTYSQLDRDTLVLVLSGAYRDRLVPYTWWFPIVGRVPYKGYFDFLAATRRGASSSARRASTCICARRPHSARSAGSTIRCSRRRSRADSLDLANTVIHELTHNTFYARGQAVFNESFANFVGARGSAWFFRTRGAPAAADRGRRAVVGRRSSWRVSGRKLYASVDSAFTRASDGFAGAPRRARHASTRARGASSSTELGPQLRTISPRALERVRLDNAALLAHRIYDTDLDLFDAVWWREQGDLRRTVTRIIDLAKSQPKDPFGALRMGRAAFYMKARLATGGRRPLEGLSLGSGCSLHGDSHPRT